MPYRLLTAFAVAALMSTFTAGCASDTADDEDLGESDGMLLSGTRLTPSQIAGHLRNAGFEEDEIGRMVCTAKYESSFYERASNRNHNGSIDRGLFQINSVNLTGRNGCPTRANYTALWDPATNARCALSIFRAQGNRAWYGYRKHASECDRYPAPASANAPSSSSASDAANANDGSDEDHEGGCWSGTLSDMVSARTCVQSRNDNVWYQCMDGGWYRGGSTGTGQFGACASAHPL